MSQRMSKTKIAFQAYKVFQKAFLNVVVAGLIALPLTSCVTVNVNFPESAVQKATDDYVRDLYRAKEKGKSPSPTPEASKTSFLENFGGSLLIAQAWADAEGMFRVDTPKAGEISERLKSNLSEVIAQKRAGVLGETNDGMLKLKAPEKLKKLFIQKIEKLVADENKDRGELYAEVVRANNLGKNRLKDVQKSFARSFQAESPSGTWLQDSDGKWAQKQ
jgi:uncharacterized protein YdbL (DUF1318 family)